MALRHRRRLRRAVRGDADKMLGDLSDQGDIRAAVDHWRETGFLGEWAQVGGVGVLTEDDMKRMDRALRYRRRRR